MTCKGHPPGINGPIGQTVYCDGSCQPKPLKAPSLRTLQKWLDTGIAKATDGCKVEPDGVCPHGRKSWLLVLGYI